MNVPNASHMGGVWKRQIRTVRNVLSVLLDQHGDQLDDETLRIFLVEAEAIVIYLFIYFFFYIKRILAKGKKIRYKKNPACC